MLFVILSFVGPMFIPLDKTTKVDQNLRPPSLEHLLGADFAVAIFVAHRPRHLRILLTIAFCGRPFDPIAFQLLSARSGSIVKHDHGPCRY